VTEIAAAGHYIPVICCHLLLRLCGFVKLADLPSCISSVHFGGQATWRLTCDSVSYRVEAFCAFTAQSQQSLGSFTRTFYASDYFTKSIKFGTAKSNVNSCDRDLVSVVWIYDRRSDAVHHLYQKIVHLSKEVLEISAPLYFEFWSYTDFPYNKFPLKSALLISYAINVISSANLHRMSSRLFHVTASNYFIRI
jgi:hypothetical protein